MTVTVIAVLLAGLAGRGGEPCPDCACDSLCKSGLKNRIDSLKADTTRLGKKLAIAYQTIDSLQAVTDSLELLIHGYPSCWSDTAGTPQYLFEVTLLDDGFKLSEIDPPNQDDGTKIVSVDSATKQIGGITEDMLYSPSDFLATTQEIFNLSVAKKCRFWIDPIDSTGYSKAIFRERQHELWQRFYYRW